MCGYVAMVMVLMYCHSSELLPVRARYVASKPARLSPRDSGRFQQPFGGSKRVVLNALLLVGDRLWITFTDICWRWSGVSDDQSIELDIIRFGTG
jgi:hypothetical protein